MCHLILLMPVVALPIFWLLPLWLAGPLYAVVVLLSGALYAVVIRLMHRRAETGREGIIHASGVVERAEGDTLSVRIHGEHWMARCVGEPLAPGDPVEVVSIDGLTLGVMRGKD
jgi:membrane protein implicated in regulation of membrane protease activity